MNKKMIFKTLSLFLLVSLLASCETTKTTEGPKTTDSSVIYDQKFSEKTTKLPDDFFVMEGNFFPKKLGNEYAIFLFPRPLNTYGCLFGPDLNTDVVVSADIFTGKRGRSIPSFGIGSHGLTGFRLYVRAAREGTNIQIIYNETQVVASETYENWATDTWTSMKMLVKRVGDGVEVYGKAWPKDEKEGGWLVKYTGKLSIEEGQCSFWGIPYSGRDMFFDNLKIAKP